MNLVVLDGKVYQDPQSRKVGDTDVASFAIINTNGKKTALVGCEGWNDIAKNIMSNVQAGQEITVSGALIENSWEDKKTGQKKKTLRIRLNGLSTNVLKDVSEEVTQSQQNDEDSSDEFGF